MPKGYIIGHITVNDPDAYKEYVERDTPILEGFGGRFIVRGGASETPEKITPKPEMAPSGVPYGVATRRCSNLQHLVASATELENPPC